MSENTDLERLRAKQKARKDRPGYARNVKELEQRIAELEAKDAG